MIGKHAWEWTAGYVRDVRWATRRIVRALTGWIPTGRRRQVKVIDALTVDDGSAVVESMGTVLAVGFHEAESHMEWRRPRMRDRWAEQAPRGNLLGAAANRLGPRTYERNR